MLINLTNHPSKFWSEKQTSNAIIEFAEIKDIVFPIIPPQADAHFIKDLADTIYLKIIKILEVEGKNSAVHIMGESTFCFYMVSILLRNNIRCIASTTTRNVIYDEDGTKNSIFEFVQFRDYLIP